MAHNVQYQDLQEVQARTEPPIFLGKQTAVSTPEATKSVPNWTDLPSPHQPKYEYTTTTSCNNGAEVARGPEESSIGGEGSGLR